MLLMLTTNFRTKLLVVVFILISFLLVKGQFYICVIVNKSHKKTKTNSVLGRLSALSYAVSGCQPKASKFLLTTSRTVQILTVVSQTEVRIKLVGDDF